MMTPINLDKAMHDMKSAGAKSIRAVPMPGQSVATGLYQIEVKQEAGWAVLVEGMPKKTAEQMISQATNRVILG